MLLPIIGHKRDISLKRRKKPQQIISAKSVSMFKNTTILAAKMSAKVDITIQMILKIQLEHYLLK